MSVDVHIRQVVQPQNLCSAASPFVAKEPPPLLAVVADELQRVCRVRAAPWAGGKSHLGRSVDGREMSHRQARVRRPASRDRPREWVQSGNVQALLTPYFPRKHRPVTRHRAHLA